ncbi:hypothetical protein ACFLSE_05750, partial [Bacteroidota bacterium]
NKEVHSIVQIKMPEQIKSNQNLKYEILTQTDKGIILYDPMLVRIERFESGEWKQLKILHCPCGAYCIPPPREKRLNKNETWTYSWNLVESWCENKKGQEIPETIEIKAVPGQYRSVIFYGNTDSERLKLTKEFKIIN